LEIPVGGELKDTNFLTEIKPRLIIFEPPKK
jgi:hypothetical protein